MRGCILLKGERDWVLLGRVGGRLRPNICSPPHFVLVNCDTNGHEDRNVKSPYTISLPMQIRLCTWRGFRRLQGDMSNFIATVFGNTILAVIIGEYAQVFKVDS